MNNKKFKVFLFAPYNKDLAKMLEIHNNLREACYITPYETVPYMRVRVRKCSTTVVEIAQRFAASAGPIMQYVVGDVESDKQVATIRIPTIERYDEVVKIASEFASKIHKETTEAHKLDKKLAPVFFTCRVSKVIARTKNDHSWVEVFMVERRAVPREQWQAAVEHLAEEIGGEAEFYNAKITELSENY